MKKIIILVLFFISLNNIYAIEDIKIDNNFLIPEFNKNIYVYNYFTNNDSVSIIVDKKQNDELITLDEYKTKVVIDKYTINIFKNYDKQRSEESYIKNITIDGYDIKFDKDIHEYDIDIGNEENLNITCELSNIGDYYSIEGNGNFNKSDNIIKIKTNNDEYTIHAHKTLTVSLVKKDNEVKEMSNTKKEIVKILIITISCILVVCFYYILFINKTTLNI